MHQRPLKFRAWDGEKMRDILEIADGQVLIRNIQSAKGPSDVMQFTGLKDKNGKEIYEGDIVRWGMDGLEHEVRLATVRIDPDIQFVRFNPPANTEEREAYEYIFHFGKFAYSHEIDKVMEVLGNIYENPSLLTPARKAIV